MAKKAIYDRDRSAPYRDFFNQDHESDRDIVT